MSRNQLASVVLATVFAAGCNKENKKVEFNEEGSSQLSTAVNVADPRASIQLLRGFHDVESNAWRWTAGKFGAAFRPPKSTDGAKLYLDFVVAEAVSAKVGMPTVSVTVEGKALPPQKVTQNGQQRLEWDLPADLLKGEVVTADFSIDKYLAAGEVEPRELGLIVNSLGIQSAKAAQPEKK